MFYLIGLGLGDLTDITVKGLKIVKEAHKVYLESFTSILPVTKEELEEFYGRELQLAYREDIEINSKKLLEQAKELDVCLLVVGDPFGATTHHELVLEANEMGIPMKVIHNASIINAISSIGLQLYTFGETVSIPFWTDDWKPNSFYYKIQGNLDRQLHTLCLVDIRVKERTLASLMSKKIEYQEPRFMTAGEGAAQLMEIIGERGEEEQGLTPDSLVVAAARIGTATQKVVAAKLRDMVNIDMGPPLHSLVVVGNLHPVEAELILQFALNDSARSLIKSYM